MTFLRDLKSKRKKSRKDNSLGLQPSLDLEVIHVCGIAWGGKIPKNGLLRLSYTMYCKCFSEELAWWNLIHFGRIYHLCGLLKLNSDSGSLPSTAGKSSTFKYQLCVAVWHRRGGPFYADPMAACADGNSWHLTLKTATALYFLNLFLRWKEGEVLLWWSRWLTCGKKVTIL